MRPVLRAVVIVLLLGAGFAAGAAGKIVVMGLFKNKAVLRIDGKQHLLQAGQTSPEGVKLISADSHEAVLEVNGKRGTYKLGTQISASFAPPADRPSVHIWPSSGGTYATTGSINGFPVDFVVDTGATLIAMNRGEARRLGIEYLVDGEPGVANTASGTVKSYVVTLDRVRVGDIELRNIRAAVLDSDHPAEVLLGMSFLGRLDIRRDGQAMELQQKY